MLTTVYTCVPRARPSKLDELFGPKVPTNITKEDTSVTAQRMRNMYDSAAQVNRVPCRMTQRSTKNWNTGHAPAGKPGPARAGTFAGAAGTDQTSKTVTKRPIHVNAITLIN